MTPPDQPAVVITGASRGVGQAIALGFAASGMRVALVGRDEVSLDETAEGVRSRGGRAVRFMADLASREQVSRMANDISRTLESISLLVHSAGLFVAGTIESMSADELDRVFEVNLRAPYFLTRQLLPALIAGQAHVVFINSSIVGQRRPEMAVYGASKHGLLALADSLRQEANPLGIRVTSVFLGATATSMQEQIYAREKRPYSPEALLQPADVARIIRCAVALPPGAEVTDLHIRPSRPHRMP